MDKEHKEQNDQETTDLADWYILALAFVIAWLPIILDMLSRVR